MIKIKTILTFILMVYISGCSSTGGTFFGVPAPKFTKGEIVRNVYISKDKDFSVSIPHVQGSYEYTYMAIKENYFSDGTYVSFGPAAFDQAIYRVNIARKSTPQSMQAPLEEIAKNAIATFSKQLEEGYKSKPELMRKDNATIAGKSAVRVGLYQSVQGGTLSHDIVVVNYDQMVAIFWVQSPSDRVMKSSLDVIDFAESFKILPIKGS